MEAVPVAGGFAGSTVDNEIFGLFGDFGVKIVEKHAESGFLRPAFAGELCAARGAKWTAGSGGIVKDWGGDAHELCSVNQQVF